MDMTFRYKAYGSIQITSAAHLKVVKYSCLL